MAEQNNKMRVKGYSIWLMPDAEIKTPIVETILKLSERFESPIFPAHLTLLGQIPGDMNEILPKFRELGNSCPPMRVKPEIIEVQDVFYRSMYYKVQPTSELVDLHKRGRIVFQQESETPFFPHISLLYSSASMTEKKKVLQEYKIPTPASIHLSDLVLMKTQGEVSDWELIESVELK